MENYLDRNLVELPRNAAVSVLTVVARNCSSHKTEYPCRGDIVAETLPVHGLRTRKTGQDDPTKYQTSRARGCVATSSAN
jgi:hypothetical protein